MADMTVSDLETLLAPYNNIGDAIAMYAQRPQKTSVITDTSTYNTPYALADMIANRNKIGIESANVAEALKRQENPWYATLKALSQVQGSSEPGKWLESGLRGLATGGTILDDIKIANAQAKYENSLKDLETILKYDKEMGSAQTQRQNQILGYQEMPFGAGKGKNVVENPKDKVFKSEITASNLGDLYKTIEDNPNTFSSIGGVRQDEASRALKRGVNMAGVKEMQMREFEYLNSIMPNGFASAINAAKEQENMAPYTTAYKNGTGSEKKAQIKNMLGYIYDVYKLDANRQGYDMPITREQYIQSRIAAGRAYNPDFYIRSDAPMYKEYPERDQQQKQQEQTEKNYTKFLEGTI